MLFSSCAKQGLPEAGKQGQGTRSSCQEWTATVYTHSLMGRVYWFGTYKAIGSSDDLGFNAFAIVTLKSESPGFYEKGNCGGGDEAEVKQIISGTALANSENSYITDSGRMFVAAPNSSGSNIFEITKDASGNYSATAKYVGNAGTESCMFMGLTGKNNILYSACMNGTSKNSYLFRIDTDNDNVQSVPLTGMNQPNGMTVDSQGRIYISDTYAGENKTSIVQVVINSETPLSITQSTWLPLEHSGNYPNGIQIEGNILYFSDGLTVNSVVIKDDGTAGAFNQIYDAPGDNFIDDFCVTSKGLAIAEIPFPSQFVRGDGWVKIIDKTDGTVLKTFEADNRWEPSSVVIGKNGFDDGDLFITDYFSGGLYKIESEDY